MIARTSSPRARRAIAGIIMIAAGATIACASVSGYDASRYAATPSSTIVANEPDTEPLPRTSRKLRMLDPRSFVDASTEVAAERDASQE